MKQFLLHFYKDEILPDISICIEKLKKNELDDDDRDMIIAHLDMLSELIKEEPDGKNY